MIMLGARDFSAVKTAADRYFYAFCAHTHCSLYRLLHRAAEGYTALKLTRYTFGDKLRVEVGGLYLEYVDRYRLADHALERDLQLVDLRAAASDNHTGFRAVDEHAHALRVAFYFDFRNARVLQ